MPLNNPPADADSELQSEEARRDRWLHDAGRASGARAGSGGAGGSQARVDDNVELLGDLLRESETASPEGLNAAERVAIVQDGKPAGRGRWQVSPHLDVRGTYDDNIFIREHHKTEDYILTLAPGLAVGFWERDADRERYLERDRPARIEEPPWGISGWRITPPF